jgi:hypothetical protein
MSLKRIVGKEIAVVYLDLNENFGFYRIKPGKEPYICLDEKLLEGSQGVYLTVYQTLLNYHRAIPADSIYRCFPMVRYFEELIPLPNAKSSSWEGLPGAGITRFIYLKIFE